MRFYSLFSPVSLWLTSSALPCFVIYTFVRAHTLLHFFSYTANCACADRCRRWGCWVGFIWVNVSAVFLSGFRVSSGLAVIIVASCVWQFFFGRNASSRIWRMLSTTHPYFFKILARNRTWCTELWTALSHLAAVVVVTSDAKMKQKSLVPNNCFSFLTQT